MGRLGKLAAGWLIALMVAACVSPATQPLATASLDSRFKEFTAPPGVGTVYLYAGVSRSQGIFGTSDHPSQSPNDFFVNGENIGGLNSDQYFALRLAPGVHQIAFKERATDGRMSEPYVLTVSEGQIYFLRTVFDEGSAGTTGAMFGIIGALATAGSYRVYLEPAGETGRQDILSRRLAVANKHMGDGAIEARPIMAPVAVTGPKSGAPEKTGSAGDAIETRLRDLKGLYDKKLITKEEYDRKRQQIIDAM